MDSFTEAAYWHGYREGFAKGFAEGLVKGLAEVIPEDDMVRVIGIATRYVRDGKIDVSKDASHVGLSTKRFKEKVLLRLAEIELEETKGHESRADCNDTQPIPLTQAQA